MRHLQDLRILVLGLGDSGLAMAQWCARHGAAAITVWDSRAQPPQLAALAAQLPEARFIHGELPEGELGGIQLVLKSPGLSPLDERLVPLLALARNTGVPVQGELDLFARALADLKAERRYEPAVLAITGTNGKTTTTCMTALLVERCGKRVAVAGNIGPSMLGLLGEAIDAEPLHVAEAEAPAESVADAATPATASAIPVDANADATAAVDTETAAAGGMERRADGEVEAGMADASDIDVGAVPATAADAAAEPLAETPVAIEGTEVAAPSALGTSVADALAAPSALGTSVVDASAAPSALEMVDALLDEAPLPIKPPPPKGPTFEVLPEVWVLELSSFQLDTVPDHGGFEPTAAAVLNITQDHLDWHGDMPAYGRAKQRIFGPSVDSSTVMVINRDDPLVEALVPAPVMVKQGRGRAAKAIERKVVRFGLDGPDRPGDFGLVNEGGMAWLVRAREADETVKKRRGEDEEILIQRLMPADALRVRGRHNAANALAALALATAADCPLAPMLHGLREYRGEPHRVEHVATLEGIDFYDDSKGTNVGATVAAITGLGADRAPAKLVLILGGDGKGQDFAPLAAGVARHARAVALIGRDGPQIEAALAGCGVPLVTHATLEAATVWCFEQAQSGDSVLLSPACASLDMFRNYAHRAEVFVAAVEALAQDKGAAL